MLAERGLRSGPFGFWCCWGRVIYAGRYWVILKSLINVKAIFWSRALPFLPSKEKLVAWCLREHSIFPFPFYVMRHLSAPQISSLWCKTDSWAWSRPPCCIWMPAAKLICGNATLWQRSFVSVSAHQRTCTWCWTMSAPLWITFLKLPVFLLGKRIDQIGGFLPFLPDIWSWRFSSPQCKRLQLWTSKAFSRINPNATAQNSMT